MCVCVFVKKGKQESDWIVRGLNRIMRFNYVLSRFTQNFNGNELSSPFCTLYFIQSLYMYCNMLETVKTVLLNLLCKLFYICKLEVEKRLLYIEILNFMYTLGLCVHT